MKSLSRWVAGFAACSVLALTLTACGGDEPTTEETEKKDGATEKKDGATEKKEGAAEKKEDPADKKEGAAEKKEGAVKAAEGAAEEVAFKCTVPGCVKTKNALASAPPTC